MLIDYDVTLVRGRPAPQRNSTTAPARSGSPATTNWRRPVDRSRTAAAPSLQPGSVLKSRFILEEPIGRGGMGTVFKARDLRKEEANDRNPHVAIKVLNDDFKEHPGALQALQRESRKSQLLAHPNIMTVHDFDRDDGNVFMVMELLQGIPLDRLIKLHPNGLGVKEALRVMRGICRAMAYAHDKGILHADFKPANAFITLEGVAKVFDFGIARAVKFTERPDAGTQTLFDPGSFGALTPAYAGCEVIEGEGPDPRDDIYAMACVTYELMTGSHPYNRLSAVHAERAHMTPDPPPGMPSRRWRVLRRALSLRREGRPLSATDFIDGISPFGGSPATYAAVGMSFITALTVAAVPVSLQINKVRARSTVAALASADASRIEPVLQQLRTLEPTESRSVLVNDDARNGVITYYSTRIRDAIDPATGHTDYQQAEALLHELEGFFPDSQAVRDLRDRVTAQRTAALQLLQASSPAESALQSIAPAPKHHLKTPTAHAVKVLNLTPSPTPSALDPDTALADLRDKTESLLARPTCDDAWDADLQQRLTQLDGYSPQTDSYIREIKHRVVALYVIKSAELRGAGQFDDASRALARSGEYESHPTPERLLEQALLDDARTRHSLADHKAEREAYLGALKRKLSTEAAANNIDSAEITLRVLRENLPVGDRFLTRDGPQSVAQACERAARQLLEKGQLAEAAGLMARAQSAAPDSEPLARVQERYRRYQALDEYLQGDERPDVHKVQTEIAALYAQDSNTAKVVLPILANDLASRLHATGDHELAVRLSAVGNEVFGAGPPFRRD